MNKSIIKGKKKMWYHIIVINLEELGLLLAANNPCGDTNEPSMKSLLYVLPVQVFPGFALYTHIYFLPILLQI